jgi:ketosteroid isomerase-like protein
MRTLLFAALLVGACAGNRPAAELPSAAPIIAAERAFAADAGERGWAAAFRSWAAPDAITLSPDPVNAQENLAQFEGDGETTLDWRPAYAGLALSGDFGFTTGPFQIRGREGIVGHYFTVWRRQRDGSWKWIFDAGTDVRDPGPAVAVDAEIPTLPVALESAGSAEEAIAEVSAIETQIASGGAIPSEALSRRLAHNARVNRPGAAAAVDRAAAVALVVADGGVGYRALRQEAASSGDMVFTLGEVRDQHEGAERLRYYARIWQRRPEGWRVVFDEIVPRRGQ